jgi:hypothetical protein
MKSRALFGLFTVLPLSVAIVLGASSTAGASGSVTVTIGGPIQVTNRLLVSVPVNVVCDPLSGDTVLVDRVSVQLQQANGKTVSQGSASVEGGPFSPFLGSPFLTCDGSTVNTVTVKIVGSGPFHGGKAIATASATHTVGTCSFFCSPTDTESGVVGPSGVNVRG